MAKKTAKDLQVIGTARKPNKSDLRRRGITGLPDPSPEVTLRRAEFESAQAELRARTECFGDAIPVSFLRTEIDARKDDLDDKGLWECERDESGRCEDVAAGINGGGGCDGEKMSMLTARVDVTDAPESSGEPGKKAVRKFRDRSPIQICPYALEREEYRQRIKTGRV